MKVFFFKQHSYWVGVLSRVKEAWAMPASAGRSSDDCKIVANSYGAGGDKIWHVVAWCKIELLKYLMWLV